MNRLLSRFLVFFLTLMPFGALAQSVGRVRQASTLYKEALKLFNYPEPTASTDSIALVKLVQVTSIGTLSRTSAPVFFDCYEKAGILKQTYGSYQQATSFYRKAIACCITYHLSDSLLFKPYLYCGLSYYFSNSFDSSLCYLGKSEAILLKSPKEQEAQRLYNSFGALYYEAGNYQQSINYFRKAIQLNLRNNHPKKAALMYGYRSNIASALRAMGQYNSAVSMYKSLISLHINQNEVLINLGNIYLEKNQPDSALFYLKKVADAGTYNHIVLENSLASAYLEKKCLPDAFLHLNKALTLHKQQNKSEANRKSADIGRTYKLLADTQRQQHKLFDALHNYQQSIIQLDYVFSNPVIYSNPPTVTGGFRNYALFESLAAKASCMVQLYERQPSARIRQSTIETYKTALRLADYIEKSFDSEDAQLFTGQKVFSVYQGAVTFMIRSFEQTNNTAYLEDAFHWAEKSKAVSLYINLKENEIKSSTTIPDSLLKKERTLKINLSRLRIKIDRANSNNQIAILTSEMQDNELILSRLANKLLDYPDYRRRKFSLDTINIDYLRTNLIKQRHVLISYFQASDTIYCFVLTHNSIHHYKFRRDSSFYQALHAVSNQLRVVTPGLAYKGHRNARFLYNKLIKPAEQYLKNATSLLIIPHNELGLLPFDVLEDEQDHYLLEKFDVTYQYAASFLQNKASSRIDVSNTLAMAPFDSSDTAGFDRLAASDNEINDLKGIKLRFKQATKGNFLALSGNSTSIHLATHAIADNNDPARSYIAFYTKGKDGGKLYAHELRAISLSNVHLVFLSACETGSGKLINGEGVMSLSRAFSSAGCSNIVTSLWKAEDKATAYISLKFYAYLEQGYDHAQALRKAKLDLLYDGQYAQFHSPQYWSHLVFIGVPGAPTTYGSSWLWLSWGAMVLAALIFLGLYYRKKRE